MRHLRALTRWRLLCVECRPKWGVVLLLPGFPNCQRPRESCFSADMVTGA